MDQRSLLEFMTIMFAWLVEDAFPECDSDRVMKMCLLHDMGEAVTGDVPAFEKKEEDRMTEKDAIYQIAEVLPDKKRKEFLMLLEELEASETMEAKIVHALDKMEAIIQHNEASIDTWVPLEYDLQLTYGQEQAKAHPYLERLRELIRQDTLDKIDAAVDEALDEQMGLQDKKGFL